MICWPLGLLVYVQTNHALLAPFSTILGMLQKSWNWTINMKQRCISFVLLRKNNYTPIAYNITTTWWCLCLRPTGHGGQFSGLKAVGVKNPNVLHQIHWIMMVDYQSHWSLNYISSMLPFLLPHEGWLKSDPGILRGDIGGKNLWKFHPNHCFLEHWWYPSSLGVQNLKKTNGTNHGSQLNISPIFADVFLVENGGAVLWNRGPSWVMKVGRIVVKVQPP